MQLKFTLVRRQGEILAKVQQFMSRLEYRMLNRSTDHRDASTVLESTLGCPFPSHLGVPTGLEKKTLSL